MKMYDISPILSPAIAVFPGDLAFSLKNSQDFTAEQNLRVAQIHSTLHLGSHCDAMLHTDPDGADISQMDLQRYIGPCQVIRVPAVMQPPYRLQVSDIADCRIERERLLIHTGSFPDPNQWRDDFTALSPEIIDYLAQSGVTLIGLDTPSVDPSDSKTLPSHAQCRQHGIYNIEGLVLTEVPEGFYTLVALPLKILGGDASPVRAVLLVE